MKETFCMEKFRGLLEMEKHLSANIIKERWGFKEPVPSNGDTVSGKMCSIVKVQTFNALRATNFSNWPQLFWGGRTNLEDRYLKTSEHKTETICMSGYH